MLTLYAGFEDNEAYIKSVEQALSDTDKALAEAKRELYSAVGENESYIKAVEKSLSESDLAFAEVAEDLLAKTEENSGHISELSRAISDTENALAETVNLLRAEINKGDEQTLARANEYTRAAVGYCIDKDGNITSHTNAVACVAAGHSWLDGPLAEFIRNLQVSTGLGTASVSQMGQAFVDSDGNLVAKGSMTTDVNGKVSGFVNTNNGEQSSLDIIADHHRIGIMDDGKFTPLLSLDNQLRELILRGRMILSDGYELNSKEAIQSQAGAGFYTLTLRNGVFPSDAVATQDFITTYKRKPVLDDHLTYRNTDGSASSMKRFNGSGWTAPTMIIHGDQVTLGTMHGNRLVAGTEVVAPHLRGGTGDFTGEVTAKDGSFIDKVEIGSVGGYRAFIKSVANAGHNMIVIENPSGDVVFSIQGNGNLYSIGGGYLNNLTIGENCSIKGNLDGATGSFSGTFEAEKMIGDLVSAQVVTLSKNNVNSRSWVTIGSASGINNLKAEASIVMAPIVFLLSCSVGSQNDGTAFGYCRVLINNVQVSISQSDVYVENKSSSSNKSLKNSFCGPAAVKTIKAGEAFSVVIQVKVNSSINASGSITATSDSIAQFFRKGSSFS
ncbi:hypothetical protein [Vibrio cincinnatiensis]|uniref:hypothetical protein n=1 Tax=Vibrio cincinnatiensis TaxID=675 RepID=UPI001EDD0E77|nr:hypothetical protein [Vibrio cincinnatiensis]MCG3726324.1 hypothetical protein [Vibrio cincinnatiensis]